MNLKNIVLVGSIVLLLVVHTALQASSSVPSDGLTGFPEGWSEDINISNFSTGNSKCSISSIENNVHVVWRHGYSTDPIDIQIVYSRSEDSGRNWSPFLKISNSTAMADNPDISNFQDSLHIVWNDIPTREIFYRRSLDGGNTWLPEQMISSNDGYNSVAPKIAVSEDGMSIHVVWVDERHGSESTPQNTELYYNRSLDGGVTWEGEVRLTNALYASSTQRIALYGENVHITWSDDRSGNTDLYYKRTTDNGATWSEDILLASSSNTQGPSAVAAYGSNVHIIWVEEFPGPDYYLYYRNSTDNGAAWGMAEVLTGPSPVISNPDISVQGDEVNIVWADRIDDGENAEIYFKESLDGGISWNDDLRLTNATNDSWRPSIALVNNMKHVVWHDLRDGNSETYYKRSPDFGEPIPEFGNVIVPVVAMLVMVTVATSVRRRKWG